MLQCTADSIIRHSEHQVNDKVPIKVLDGIEELNSRDQATYYIARFYLIGAISRIYTDTPAITRARRNQEMMLS